MRSADYVEETTTSIAGAGAGAVTLTAVASTPRFSTVFGTQNTTVRYVIEDTVLKKFEEGIGAVSSNVLTRTLPQTTWDGTTWSPLNPTALAFAAAPSSGDIKIRMSPVASGIGAATMPARQVAIAGDTNWRDYPISGNRDFSGGGTGFALTADREYYMPYRIDMGGVLSGVQLEVTSGVAASNIKWALYSSAGDGLPGTKIVDFVTTATVTATIKTDTASASWAPVGKVLLSPGWYYLGWLPSHAISIRGVAGGSGVGYPNPLGRKDGYGYGSHVYVAGTYASGLPAIPSLGAATMQGQSGIGPMFIGLKMVA